MKTKALDTVSHLLLLTVHDDYSVLKKVAAFSIRTIVDYADKVKKELDDNALDAQTIEAKKSLIRYYLMRFWDLQGFYKSNEELINGSISDKFIEKTIQSIDNLEERNEYKEYAAYVQNSFEIFEIIMHDIQTCCVINGLDFFKLCKEVRFSVSIIDTSTAASYEDEGPFEFLGEKDENNSLLSEFDNLNNDTKNKIHSSEKDTSIEKQIHVLLEPLRNMFNSKNHIDIIAKALFESISNKEFSELPKYSNATYNKINDFYMPFIQVWKQVGISPTKIGDVLNRHVFLHNGKQEAIDPKTARKNIYTINKKIENISNRN